MGEYTGLPRILKDLPPQTPSEELVEAYKGDGWYGEGEEEEV